MGLTRSKPELLDLGCVVLAPITNRWRNGAHNGIIYIFTLPKIKYANTPLDRCGTAPQPTAHILQPWDFEWTTTGMYCDFVSAF
jgi:hypothetical protein